MIGTYVLGLGLGLVFGAGSLGAGFLGAFTVEVPPVFEVPFDLTRASAIRNKSINEALTERVLQKQPYPHPHPHLLPHFLHPHLLPP